jgi:hypothetical protein
MFADLRVPVEPTRVQVVTLDGARHDLVVFRAPGLRPESLLESHEPFFPAREGDTLRLFATANISALIAAAPKPSTRPEDELPESRRAVRVQLTGGVVISGEIRYVACEVAARPIDHLNEPSPSFAVFSGEHVHHVVKAHVLFVEEAAPA